jgi:hypothetical protein
MILIFWLLLAVVLLIVAGRIILATFPATFGATKQHLSLFVLGGFVGIYAFPLLFAGMIKIFQIRITQNIDYLLVPLAVAGALTFGTGFVWLKRRFYKS